MTAPTTANTAPASASEAAKRHPFMGQEASHDPHPYRESADLTMLMPCDDDRGEIPVFIAQAGGATRR
jgi:hypothetical protein